MKTIYRFYKYFFSLVVVAFLSSCNEEDDLPFQVVESPVLAVFKGQTFAVDAPVIVSAKFYDLDKSGILDNTVGIDSVEVANLPVTVFISETSEVANLTTDASGVATLETNWTAIGGVGNVVLEWVGRYDNQDFRIYHTVSAE